jgi:polyhydroxyalkanoate synthesis regulator phasin
MTESELEKLAQRIADLVMESLIEKQKEWDQQFTSDVNEMFTGSDLLHNSEEELLLAELARLMTLLATYEEKEQYEKAAIIHNKIKTIENKINKL